MSVLYSAKTDEPIDRELVCKTRLLAFIFRRNFVKAETEPGTDSKTVAIVRK